jgi:hypothetical protein
LEQSIDLAALAKELSEANNLKSYPTSHMWLANRIQPTYNRRHASEANSAIGGPLMPVFLSISAADMDNESLQELTRQLCQDLRSEAGIESSLAKESAGPEAKSGADLEIIGQIMVKAVGAGGAIVALVNVLKAYVARRPFMQIKIRKKNGDTLEVRADDLRGNDVTKLIQTIKDAFEET